MVEGFSLLAVVLWVAGSGCSGSGGQPPSPQPPAPAKIQISSRLIEMGNVAPNNTYSQTVTIQNTGSTKLNIGQIAQLKPLSPPFTIPNDGCSGQAVQPSSTCSVDIKFSPTQQVDYQDSFDIPSDASNGTSVIVSVKGSGKKLRAVINQVSCSAGVLEAIVTVSTLTNAFVTGLATGSFQLSENLVSQPITSVSELLSPRPVSIAMLLDYTTSMQSQIPTVELASKNFVGLMNAGDEAAVIKFAQSQQIMQDFTSDQALLTAAIGTAPSLIGRQDETRLYDALYFAVGKVAARQNIKAIVVITDGVDVKYTGVSPASIQSLDQVIAYATANGVAIYPVGLGYNVDTVVMNRLANETMGQYFQIANASGLAAVYGAIKNILSGKYSIKYTKTVDETNPLCLAMA